MSTKVANIYLFTSNYITTLLKAMFQISLSKMLMVIHTRFIRILYFKQKYIIILDIFRNAHKYFCKINFFRVVLKYFKLETIKFSRKYFWFFPLGSLKIRVHSVKILLGWRDIYHEYLLDSTNTQHTTSHDYTTQQ